MTHARERKCHDGQERIAFTLMDIVKPVRDIMLESLLMNLITSSKYLQQLHDSHIMECVTEFHSIVRHHSKTVSCVCANLNLWGTQERDKILDSNGVDKDVMAKASGANLGQYPRRFLLEVLRISPPEKHDEERKTSIADNRLGSHGFIGA